MTHNTKPRTYVVAFVPGMREIGWAHAVHCHTRPAATIHDGVELLYWGTRHLPRGIAPFDRIRWAQGWLDELLVRHRIDLVRLVLPEPHHLTQRKNASKLGVMVAGLHHTALLDSLPCCAVRRSVLLRELRLSGSARSHRRIRLAIAAALLDV